MCKTCLNCELSKYEIEQQRKYNGKINTCITKNGRHQFKKQARKPKVNIKQLEFIIY